MSDVINIWSGRQTPSGAWVRGRVDESASSVRLAVSTNENMSDPTFFGPETPTDHDVVSIEATGLEPDTLYNYAFEVDSVLDTDKQGKFRTFPEADSAQSFKFAAFSCALGETSPHPEEGSRVSNHEDFGSITPHDPLFLCHVGDMHYRDIGSGLHGIEDPPWEPHFREAYDDVMAAPNQDQLYRDMAIVYTWDDHDYGPNDSDKDSPSRSEARQVFRERVPHYDLPAAGAPDAGIWYSFQVGRVLFIVTDDRSERDPKGDEDGENKMVLGTEQENWMFDLLETSNAECICWVNAYPWIAAQSAGADHWGGYATERQKITDKILAEGWQERFFIVSGDMHALAIGTDSDNSWGRFPVYQFASMDTFGSTKGGPYTFGPSEGQGRYGVVEIDDRGDRIRVTGTGYVGDSAVMSHSFRVPRPRALVSVDITRDGVGQKVLSDGVERTVRIAS